MTPPGQSAEAKPDEKPKPKKVEEGAAPAKKPAADAKPKPKPAPKPAPKAVKPEPGPEPKPEPRRGDVVRHPASRDRQAARAATPRRRHRVVALSFLLAVVLPTVAAGTYLYTRAADQFASTVAFSVRSGEAVAPTAFLGALTNSLSSTGTDAQIIYEFLRSQQMVETAMAELPYREWYGLPQEDVVFRLSDEATLEDVNDYWRWMTDVTFDGGTGIVTFTARAFRPQDAQAVSELALRESTRLVNELSEEARRDAVDVAVEALAAAEERLRDARLEVRAFRRFEREIDPEANALASSRLVASLEEKLADAEIELSTRTELVGERATELPYLRQRIESLRARIASERNDVGGTEEEPGRPLADLLAEYEKLQVDLRFAQDAYVSARAAYDHALFEGQKQQRYLSPHIRPTLSEEAQHPARLLMTVGIFFLALVAWATLVLIIYNIRDRR